MNHKKLYSVIVVLLGICFMAVPLLGGGGTNFSSASHRPDLEYLKAVNQVAPPRDPQLLFLLMAQPSHADRNVPTSPFCFWPRLRLARPVSQ